MHGMKRQGVAMPDAEVFSRCLPHTAALTPGIGGIPELTWEDVMLSVRGQDKAHDGFLFFVHLCNPKGRHDFYAGLMQEITTNPKWQRWILNNPGNLDRLVRLAMQEWQEGRAKYTSEKRAYLFGVRPHVWRRKYQDIYSAIAAIPAEWESIIMQKSRRRLRR